MLEQTKVADDIKPASETGLADQATLTGQADATGADVNSADANRADVNSRARTTGWAGSEPADGR